MTGALGTDQSGDGNVTFEDTGVFWFAPELDARMVQLDQTFPDAQVTGFVSFFDPLQNKTRTVAVQIVTEATVPALSFGLDPATDSGAVGDDLTNFARVNLVGSTDPLQAVLLDLDGDGFNDGTVTADAAGQFTFTNVPLVEGANSVRLQATNPQGTTTRGRTITLDTLAPRVVDVVINGGEVQRSKVTTIEVQFSENVVASLGGADLSLQNLTANNTIAAADVAISFDAATNTATWTFPDLTGDSLPDGNYLVTLLATGVRDAAGNTLDSDGNGTSGDDFTFDFFRYYGDLDADRDVDFYDLFWFQKTYLKGTDSPEFNPALDYEGDGDVEFAELMPYEDHYFTVLAPPTEAGPAGQFDAVRGMTNQALLPLTQPSEVRGSRHRRAALARTTPRPATSVVAMAGIPKAATEPERHGTWTEWGAQPRPAAVAPRAAESLAVPWAATTRLTALDAAGLDHRPSTALADRGTSDFDSVARSPHASMLARRSALTGWSCVGSIRNPTPCVHLAAGVLVGASRGFPLRAARVLGYVSPLEP